MKQVTNRFWWWLINLADACIRRHLQSLQATHLSCVLQGLSPMTLAVANLYFSLCRITSPWHPLPPSWQPDTGAQGSAAVWVTQSMCENKQSELGLLGLWGRDRERQTGGDADKNTGAKIDTVLIGAFRAHSVDLKAWDQWCESDPLLCVSHFLQEITLWHHQISAQLKLTQATTFSTEILV